MGAGTSPAGPASADAVAGPEAADPRPGSGKAPGGPADPESPLSPEVLTELPGPPELPESSESSELSAEGVSDAAGGGKNTQAGGELGNGSDDGPTGAGDSDGSEASDGSETSDGSEASDGAGEPRTPEASRRFSLTHDTARPEGGGRAAPGDAPAPARQWPLLAVLCTAGAGLLIVAVDSFTEAFRVGVILIGIALLAGAVLRWMVPSVGMLAVRSRFTDLITYGVMGTLIVLLALMAQPRPWLYVPFLQDVVHFTIR